MIDSAIPRKTQLKTSTAFALLIVDDNAIIRRAVSMWAAAKGFDVSCACDGREATGFLLTRQFHVVLTDFNMPGMNGWTLVKWMRKYRPEVPVCMMSADAADKDFRAAIEPYVDGLLAKPFLAVELEICIKNAVLRKGNFESPANLRE